MFSQVILFFTHFFNTELLKKYQKIPKRAVLLTWGSVCPSVCIKNHWIHFNETVSNYWLQSENALYLI